MSYKMKGLVSINLSLYGQFSLDRMELAFESIANQSYYPIEIILSEQNPSPTFEENAKRKGLTYCFSEIILADGKPYFSPSKIRNAGISVSDGEFIYITDGDIVLKNRHFIENLVELARKDPNSFLVKPAMRRLQEHELAPFMARVKVVGLSKALDCLFYPDDYIASLVNKESDTVAIRYGPRKIYTTSREKFERYRNNPSLVGFDPRIWSDVVHYGNIFARKRQMQSIAGYSEQFLHWGYEDVDVQWKLRCLYNHLEIPKSKEMEVLHLDHPKNYFSRDIAGRNRLLHERRIALGIEEAIDSDRRLNTVKL